MLYPQNGDRIVAIDSVTSLHPMNSLLACLLFNESGAMSGGGEFHGARIVVTV